SFIYYHSPKRRCRFRGSMKGWLKGNVCLSAAKDERERILGRKVKEEGVDPSGWKRQNPSTGLPGKQISLYLNVGTDRRPTWEQEIVLPEPTQIRTKPYLFCRVEEITEDGKK